jgi:hypothetical protein
MDHPVSGIELPTNNIVLTLPEEISMALRSRRRHSAAAYFPGVPMLILHTPGARDVSTIATPYSIKYANVLNYLMHEGKEVGFSIALTKPLTPGTHRVTECLKGLPKPFIRDIKEAFVPKHYKRLPNITFVV